MGKEIINDTGEWQQMQGDGCNCAYLDDWYYGIRERSGEDEDHKGEWYLLDLEDDG